MKSRGWLCLGIVVPLLVQCAKPPPPPKPEWAFNASIAMTPEALAKLQGYKAMVLDVYYYGPIAPGSKQQPDAVGRVRLGNDLFDTSYDGPPVHVTGIGVDQSLLGDVVNREVYLQITAYSTKETPPDNPLLSCNTYIGTTTMARATPPIVTCDKYRP